MMGPEHLLADSIRLGGDGGVSGGANILPQLFVDCYKAAKAGDKARLSDVQAVIDKLQKIYDIGKYASRHIKATKCSLSLLGICDDFMAEPFQRFLPPERERFRQCLAELNLPQLQALVSR